MKNILRSYKGFVFIMPLILFISIISCLIYYSSLVRVNLETIVNLKEISNQIVFKTKVYKYYQSLIKSTDEIYQFEVDDVVITYVKSDDVSKLVYDNNEIILP